MRKVYLDNAATTALSPRVLEAMLPYFTQYYGNPSSVHAFGRESLRAVDRVVGPYRSRVNYQLPPVLYRPTPFSRPAFARSGVSSDSS